MTCTSAPLTGDSPQDESVHNSSVPPMLILQATDDIALWRLDSNHIHTNLDPVGLTEPSGGYPHTLHLGHTSPPSWSVNEPFLCEQERLEHAEPNWVPTGPGWFDSSWLLRQGLEVREIESLSALDSRFET
jgi:hypothetical protein